MYYNIMKERYSVVDYITNDHLFKPVIKCIYKKFNNDVSKKKIIEIHKILNHIYNRKQINSIFEILLIISDKKYHNYFKKYREVYMKHDDMLIMLKNKKNSILRYSMQMKKTLFRNLFRIYGPIPGDIKAKIVALDIRYLHVLGKS